MTQTTADFLEIDMGNSKSDKKDDDEEIVAPGEETQPQPQPPSSSGGELHLRFARLQKYVELNVNTGGVNKKEEEEAATTANAAAATAAGGAVAEIGDDSGNNKNKRTSLTKRISRIAPGAINGIGGVAGITTTEKKIILNDVSGEAKPGEVIALMGPSGSGKTSLMNVLSGRAAYQEGSISINGTLLDKVAMKRFQSKVAYVKQHDLFFEELTVRDQLTYTARLRIPDGNGVSKTARKEKIRTEVDRIIRLLRLTKCADSKIFMCSGGEKKRVNIGTELITDPAVVLLDEPTSGLDSASAVSLLNVLKDLAKRQRKTIITSIHQPNSESFLNFDKLMMLSEGHVVYFGPPKDSLEYLRRNGLACPPGYNLADHWMNLLVTDSSVEEERKEQAAAAAAAAVKNGDTEVSSSTSEEAYDSEDESSYPNKKKNDDLGVSPRFRLQETWDKDGATADRMEAGVLDDDKDGITTQEGQQQQLRQRRRETFAKQGRRSSVETIFDEKEGQSKYTTTWRTQFSTLLSRALNKSKSTVFSPINILKTVAIGVLTGLVYLDQRYTESDVFNIFSYFYFTMVYWVMTGMFESLFEFPMERTFIMKERATASYHLSAYFAAMTVSDLPVFLCMPCIYMIISYWMTVPTFGFVKFVAILCISFLSIMTGQGLGQLTGAAFDDIKIGQAVATVVILFLMLLGGFFARNLPLWLSWVGYLSPFKYAANAALLVIFDEPIPCDGSGALGGMCETENAEVPAEDVLTSPEMNVELSLAANLVLLVVFCFVPRYFTYAILRKKKGGERE